MGHHRVNSFFLLRYHYLILFSGGYMQDLWMGGGGWGWGWGLWICLWYWLGWIGTVGKLALPIPPQSLRPRCAPDGSWWHCHGSWWHCHGSWWYCHGSWWHCHGSWWHCHGSWWHCHGSWWHCHGSWWHCHGSWWCRYCLYEGECQIEC